MKDVRYFIASLILTSRWLLTPYLLGLIVGLAVLAYKFMLKLGELIVQVPGAPLSDVIVGLLSLVDLTLAANLIVLVICSVYENFLMRIDASAHPNIPDSLVKISFSDLKQKLLGSIVAIAAVNTLEWFMDIEHQTDYMKLVEVLAALIAFAITMLVVALADRLRVTSDH